MKRFDKILFIVNSGSRRGNEVRKGIEKYIKNYDIDYDIVITTGHRQGIYLAEKYGESEPQSTLITAVGGDGTLNDVITGFHSNGIERPLAFIPSGTGNDFAIAEGIPIDTKKALKHLFKVKSPKKLDIIKGETKNEIHYAVNSIGFGLDGRTIYNIETKSLKHSGWTNFMPSLTFYISSAIRAYREQSESPVTLTIEGEKYHFPKAKLATVFNHGNFGGGIPLLPEANAEDGLLDIFIGNDVSTKDFAVILKNLLVNQSHLRHEKIHTFRSDRFELFIDGPEYGQKDGEWLEQKKHHLSYSVSKQQFWI